MQQIADATGVTRATVSLALRAHPSISLPTRRRVEECAERLGYRPNPMISALMTNLRQGSREAPAATLAYLSPFTLQQMRSTPAAQRYFDGAKARAYDLGYQLEFFCLEEFSASRLATILRTRAIRGLLIAPAFGENDEYALDLPWDEFCATALGYTLRRPVLDRAVNHQYHTIGLAVRRATALGYQRIGLLLSHHDDARTEKLWQAGYLVYQQTLPVGDRLPIGFLNDLPRSADLKNWVRRHQPDVVLVLRPEVIEALRGATAKSAGPGLILLDRSPVHAGIAGVDQRPDLVGIAGIDLMVKRLLHNDHGLPATQNTVLIEGEWVDDASLPDRSVPQKIPAKTKATKTTKNKV